MVCPNCHSHEVIAVQGQYFCIACGQLIPPEVVAAETKPELTKRRKPGRPKAGRLDVPKPVPVSAQVIPHEVSAPVLRPHARRMSDIAPKPKPKPDTEPAAERTPDPTPTSVAYGEAVSSSLHQRWQHRMLGLAAAPAALGAVVVGAVVFVSHLPLSRVVDATHQAGWAVYGEGICIALLYYVSRNLTQAAMMFGAARQADHRPVPVARWWGVAVNSLGVRLRFDLLMAVLQLLIIGFMTELVFVGAANWPVTPWVQMAIVFMAFMSLAYALVGLLLVQGLGRVAVTLGSLPAWRSLQTGWRLYRHHFELVGARVLELLLELILAAPFVVGVTLLATIAPSGYRWLAAPAAALVALVGGASAGAGAAIWWQNLYRKLVRHDRLGEAMALIAGRKPEHARRWPATFAVTLLVILSVSAIAWPWIVSL